MIFLDGLKPEGSLGSAPQRRGSAFYLRSGRDPVLVLATWLIRVECSFYFAMRRTQRQFWAEMAQESKGPISEGIIRAESSQRLVDLLRGIRTSSPTHYLRMLFRHFWLESKKACFVPFLAGSALSLAS